MGDQFTPGSHFDAIVIGTGGIGSAALYQLARRGGRVLGLDRYPPAHDRGSSHGETRLIRLSYFENDRYVPLLQRAYQLWGDLESGLPVRCGVLYCGRPDSEVLAGVRASAAAHQLSLQPAPPHGDHFAVPHGFGQVFEPDAGYLPVEHCVRLHLQRAQEAGALYRHGIEVRRWSESGRGLRLDTSAGEFTADRLVICAGSWSSALLAGFGLQLTVLRKHLHWFDRGALRHRCGFFCEREDGAWYGFPELQGLIKIAEHSGGEVVADPDRADRGPDPEETARMDRFVRAHLPGLGPRVRQATCFYTMSPDGHFIVDRVPGSSRVVFAAGLSGHGFKFASVLGDILADLALEGGCDFDIGFLGASRFAESSLPEAPA